jgi:uncharacterized membrane protein
MIEVLIYAYLSIGCLSSAFFTWVSYDDLVNFGVSIRGIIFTYLMYGILWPVALFALLVLLKDTVTEDKRNQQRF